MKAWIFYVCYTVNNAKFLNLMIRLEEINDKFSALERDFQFTFITNFKYCAVFEICAFTLNTLMQALFLLPIMKQRHQELKMIFTTSATILLTSVISLVEIYVSVLYLLTADRITTFYQSLYENLGECFSSLRRRRGPERQTSTDATRELGTRGRLPIPLSIFYVLIFYSRWNVFIILELYPMHVCVCVSPYLMWRTKTINFYH